MRPIRLTITPDVADLTRYASSVTGDSWTLTETNSSDSLAHTVTIRNNSATDHSSIQALLLGTDAQDKVITELLSLPIGSGTVTTIGYFKTLTVIAPSATIGFDTMSIGQGAGTASILMGLNWRGGITSVNLDITGTLDVTVQQTFDDIQDPDDFDYAWQDSPSVNLVNATASTNDAYDGVPTALRLIYNSFTTGASTVITVIQRDV